MSKHTTRTRAVLGFGCLCLVVALAIVAARAEGERPKDSPAGAPLANVDQLNLNKGDHIAIIGNALPDRMQHDGYFETLVHAKFPQHELVFRNLSAAADEVSTWHRSENFGSRDDWLTRVKADVILAFYGFNESFKGDAGLVKFKADLDQFIKQTQAKNYSGKSKPRLVLFSPAAAERNRDPNLPDPASINVNLQKYVAAMAEVAKTNNTEFVDLFTPSQGLYTEAARAGKSLTVDGLHLTEEGDHLLAPAMFRDVFGESAPEGDFEKLRAAVNVKNAEWHSRYRTMDGYNVYGGRSALAYQPDEGGFVNDRDAAAPRISNYKVMQEEMSQRDVITADDDKAMWAVASGAAPASVEAARATQASPLPAVDPVKTNHPGTKADGSHTFLGGEEAISKMKVPAHCKVNLFASEEQFPELIKPVQMAWDTRGRLWVAAWRNYPERTPTSKVGDSILIFEDTDGDGKADKCTHFIDDLNCPTGFQFYKDGILLMQAPDLWFARDTNGDGKADSIERVLMGMDSADSHHTTNSMVLDPGGATYLSDGVFHRTQVETAKGPVRNDDAAIYRFEPRTGKFETYAAYAFANPHGRVFDYWGNDVITDATGNASYFAPAFTGQLDYPAKHPKMEQFWQRPSRPCAGTGLMTSKHFPEEFWGNFLNCNVISFQGIYRVKVKEEGSGLSGSTIPDALVSSTDPNFRPTAVNVGPDGAVYFADWSNSIIGHMQHHLRDPNRDHVHGRIYRMTYEGRPLDKAPKIDGQPISALLELLKETEDHIRTLAKIELGKHEAAEVIPAVNKWAAALDKNDPAYEHHMTEALWVHQWFNVIDADLLKKMLRSPDAHARAAATRVLCYWREALPDALTLLRPQASDDQPRVRLEAVRTASFFRDSDAADIALTALTKSTDYYIDYTLKETMRQLQPYWRKAIAEGKPVSADNPKGLDYLVSGLNTAELLKMPRIESVLKAILVHDGVADADRQAALVALADQRKATTSAVLLESMDSAKKSPAAAGALAKLLPAQPPAELATIRKQLETLANKGAAGEIRQPAWAALAAADGTFDKVWAAASQSPDKLIDLIASVPLVFNPDLRGSMYDRAASFLAAELPKTADVLKAMPTVNGRFVRVELQKKGILSLAEVQVFSGGKNVALEGKAKQSSTDMSADASRAIDGRTDGNLPNGSVTHTLRDNKAWWEVDLGSSLPIDSVAIWPRSDDEGKSAKAIGGASLIVFDDAHKESFKKTKLPEVAGENLPVAVGADGLGNLRGAAIRAVVSIQANQPATFATLVGMIERGDQVPAAAHGIKMLPPKSWSREQAPAAANALLKWAKTVPVSQRTGEEYVQTTQLAGDLAGLMPANQAIALRKELKEMRVAVFVLSTVREQMRYDSARLVVEAGKPFEIILENTDFMPHNLAIVKPGSREKIGNAVLTMKPDEFDSQGRAYIPPGGDILAATRLVESGQKTRLSFTAPAQEGDLEYVCTFPGHWEAMWGKMIVTKDVDAYLQSHPDAGPAPTAAPGHEHHH